MMKIKQLRWRYNTPSRVAFARVYIACYHWSIIFIHIAVLIGFFYILWITTYIRMDTSKLISENSTSDPSLDKTNETCACTHRSPGVIRATLVMLVIIVFVRKDISLIISKYALSELRSNYTKKLHEDTHGKPCVYCF